MANQKDKNLDEIQCPQCGYAIPISEALRHQLTEELNEQIEKRETELKKREKELGDQEKALGKRVQKEVAAAVAGREAEMQKRESEVALAEKNIAGKVKDALEKEKLNILAKAKREAEETVSIDVRDMQAQLAETQQKLKKSESAELELRKRERELAEREKNAELEAARKLSAQRAEIEGNVAKRLAEEHRMKDLEKEKIISDLKRAVEEANRKAQQGSQQLQGEVQELDLEALLKDIFPSDEIRPVPKGVRGADVLQIVTATSGKPVGSILWESKRTKNWSDAWVGKLKDDQREAKADIAVIVSDVLPKDLPNSGYRDRIWITNYGPLRLLAVALRTGLLQVASARLAAENKEEISDMLFRYVTGSEFRQKVEAIVDTFKEMRESIEKDKRATIARWAKQEKQIDKAIAITAGTYGDLRGLIGTSMQTIPALEGGAEPENNNERKSEERAAITTTAVEPEEIDSDDIPF